MRLSDLVVRNLAAPLTGQKTYYDETLPSFGCRISQGGTKTFIVRHGAERTLVTLGRYPILTLAEARQLARERLAEIVLGKHRPKSIKWDEAVEEYLTECRTKNRASTVGEYERHIKGHFAFSSRKVADLDYTDFLRKLNKLTDTPSERNHALTAVKVFLNWCKKPPRRYILSNPCEGLSPQKRPSRARILSDAELQLIWRACGQTAGSETVGVPAKAAQGSSPSVVHETSSRLPAIFTTIVKLLILTGQRKGEIAALIPAFYSHNQQTICLPATLTKNHREHTFPVGQLATTVLLPWLPSQKTTLLFPGKTGKRWSGFGKAKEQLDKLSGVTGWTLHDLRRTFKTNLSKLGVMPHISERIINHISHRDPMEDVYDLYRYLPEMRAAMNLWEAKLEALFSAETLAA